MNDKKDTWRAICQTCHHFADEHPKNADGNRPCSKEMQFPGISVFCYCDKLDFVGNWKPKNFPTGV